MMMTGTVPSGEDSYVGGTSSSSSSSSSFQLAMEQRKEGSIVVVSDHPSSSSSSSDSSSSSNVSIGGNSSFSDEDDNSISTPGSSSIVGRGQHQERQEQQQRTGGAAATVSTTKDESPGGNNNNDEDATPSSSTATTTTAASVRQPQRRVIVRRKKTAGDRLERVRTRGGGVSSPQQQRSLALKRKRRQQLDREVAEQDMTMFWGCTEEEAARAAAARRRSLELEEQEEEERKLKEEEEPVIVVPCEEEIAAIRQMNDDIPSSAKNVWDMTSILSSHGISLSRSSSSEGGGGGAGGGGVCVVATVDQKGDDDDDDEASVVKAEDILSKLQKRLEQSLLHLHHHQEQEQEQEEVSSSSSSSSSSTSSSLLSSSVRSLVQDGTDGVRFGGHLSFLRRLLRPMSLMVVRRRRGEVVEVVVADGRIVSSSSHSSSSCPTNNNSSFPSSSSSLLDVLLGIEIIQTPLLDALMEEYCDLGCSAISAGTADTSISSSSQAIRNVRGRTRKMILSHITRLKADGIIYDMETFHHKTIIRNVMVCVNRRDIAKELLAHNDGEGLFPIDVLRPALLVVPSTQAQVVAARRPGATKKKKMREEAAVSLVEFTKEQIQRCRPGYGCMRMSNVADGISEQGKESVRSVRRRMLLDYANGIEGNTFELDHDHDHPSTTKNNHDHEEEGGGGGGGDSGVVEQEHKKPSRNDVFDETMMTQREFATKSALITQALSLFVKTLRPGLSRPSLKAIALSPRAREDLLTIFFDDDGSLKEDVANDIDVSTPHNDPGYIDFGNNVAAKREDKRFQMFLKKHPTDGGERIKTRERVEAIFGDQGVLNYQREILDHVGILIGGTEDQSLHHDVSRQYVKWRIDLPTSASGGSGSSNTTPGVSSSSSVDNEAESTYLDGWEIDRVKYNETMSSLYAPSSILVGFGNDGKFLLGVQKDKIIRRSLSDRKCTILGGCGESYSIVRENKDMVVIQVPTACIFAGDFPHAGVRNFRPGSAEAVVMKEVIDRISTVVHKYPGTHENHVRSQAIVNALCKVRDLRMLCRLHCSTQALEDELVIPQNTVGYDGCWQNQRDSRCYDDDTAQEEE